MSKRYLVTVSGPYGFFARAFRTKHFAERFANIYRPVPAYTVHVNGA